jgi:hypothetical protein
VTLFVLTLAAALGASIALTAASESIVAGGFVRTIEARYAAEAALERAIVDLRSAADLSPIVAGLVQSTFVDGPPGMRRLADGSALDLASVVSLANCGKSSACSSADLASNSTGQRPWGADNPTWRLFAHGPATALLPADAIVSSCYLVVLVGDDPSETDADPSTDGDAPCSFEQTPPSCNPGSGAVALRAEAFGPRGAHQIVEAIVEQGTPGAPVRTRSQLMGGVR